MPSISEDAGKMSGVKQDRDNLVVEFESMAAARNGALPQWLRSIKEDAMERFVDLGFPTTRLEQWKYTNVAPIARTELKPASNGVESSTLDLSKLGLVSTPAATLAFVNGHYSAALSSLSTQASEDARLRTGNLGEFLKNDDENVRGRLTRYADYQDHAFVALNTAFFEDGAFIQIPSRTVVQEPIYIVFYSDGAGKGTLINPRVLILAGESSESTIVEIYAGDGQNAALTNAVTEIVLGENATIDHFKLQQESDVAFHISTVQAHQDRSATFNSHSVSLGGALVRNDVNVVLDGEGAQCSLDGLYVESGQQHVDNHTLIDHAKAHCSSRELYKGILDDRSTGVFNGSVIVRKDAQKTDALQSNKNLLLSEGAEINTKPQLEIFADDVKCSHGATIGQIDPEAVFYLRSRGLDSTAARALLVYAFSGEIISRIKSAPVRSLIGGALSGKITLGGDFPGSDPNEEL